MPLCERYLNMSMQKTLTYFVREHHCMAAILFGRFGFGQRSKSVFDYILSKAIESKPVNAT